MRLRLALIVGMLALWLPGGHALAQTPGPAPVGTGLQASVVGSQVVISNSAGQPLASATVAPLFEYSLAFSPDGSRLAFGSQGSPDFGIEGAIGHLNVISSDGVCDSEPDLGFGSPSPGNTDFSGVTWSPDGTHLVFGDGSIYQLDLGTPGAAPIVLAQGATDPSWDPLGTGIAITSFDGGVSDVAILPAGGGQRHTLIPDAQVPTWSPDGQLLAFLRMQGDQLGLFVAARDGTGIRPLAAGIGFLAPFAWSPDNSTLYARGFVRTPTGTVDQQYSIDVASGVASPYAGNLPGATGQLRVAPGDDGYVLSSANGTTYNFGASCLSLGPWSGQTVVGAATQSGLRGLWQVSARGALRTAGSAPDLGDTSGLHLVKLIVGMGGTADGNGYWLVASDGGVFSYGDAAFLGSTGGMPLNKPILGMAPTPDGKGYWLVASDGGVFSYGDATFYGSTGSLHLNKPVVGMVPTPDGGGYWLVASDGGVFSFGDARFYGSAGSLRLVRPVGGMVATANGYRLVASDGGVFTFGDARFYGSAAPVPNAQIVAGTPASR